MRHSASRYPIRFATSSQKKTILPAGVGWDVLLGTFCEFLSGRFGVRFWQSIRRRDVRLNRRLQTLASESPLDGIVAASERMLQVCRMIEKVATGQTEGGGEQAPPAGTDWTWC